MGLKPETVFRNKVRKLLNVLPNSYWESIQQRSILGTPDIFGCLNGTFVALELKATLTSPVTEMQKYKLSRIAKAGGIGLVVHPDNWQKTYELLQHLAEDHVISQPSNAQQPSGQSDAHGTEQLEA